MDNIIKPTQQDLEREIKMLKGEVEAGRELALLLTTENTDGRLINRIQRFSLKHALEMAREII